MSKKLTIEIPYEHQNSDENSPDPLIPSTKLINDDDVGLALEPQSSWSHQKDLDEFFVRIYQYHQQHGFFSISLSEIFGLIQFIFIVCFTLFLVQCVDYPLLFRSSAHSKNFTDKFQFHDVIHPLRRCLPPSNLATFLCFILASIYWFYRFLRAMHNLGTYFHIRSFYRQVLDIQPNDLSNMTWQEVQQRLILAQTTHNLCIEKSTLTELDIHNRLLRLKNYEIALVNKGILPIRIRLPIIDDLVVFTANFKFNLRFLLFRSPYAPFERRWRLRQEYKIRSQREILAKKLSRQILLCGIVNLLLSPFIFLWQLLNLFYGYTELVRREPGVLGSRRWSNYGRLYFRHFNELEHSLNQRLNRAYQPAIGYMNSFINYSLVEVAKFVSFTVGAILAVCLVLTIFDEDVLKVEHMLTLITGLGVLLGVCRSLIPEEHAVYDPETMLQKVLAQVHYQPESWRNQAHKENVRCQFAEMFQLKYVYFLEELLSPFITPILLIVYLRRKSLEIIDFLRQCTIEVPGVGDVCSFAQLNVSKNGDLKWFAPVRPKSTNEFETMNDGKLELSLMHFHHTNPKWSMPKSSENYLEKIQQRAIDSLSSSTLLQRSNQQMNRLVDGPRDKNDTTVSLNMSTSDIDLPHRSFAPHGVLSKLQSQISQSTVPFQMVESTNPQIIPLAATQLDMNVSCLFMHELRHKYRHGDYENLEEEEETN